MDAFAGIAWDEPKQTNNTLGAQQKRQLTPSLSSQSSTNNDVFSRLAAAGQPNATTSTSVPAMRPTNGGIPIASGSVNKTSPNLTTSGTADPFGGLFARGGSPNINMSMADRRAHAERERRERERREKEKQDAQGAMWDQLDSVFSGGGSNVNSRTASPSPAILQPRSTSIATPPIGLKTNPGIKQPTSPLSNNDLFWSMHHPTQSPSSRNASPALIPQRAPSTARSPPIPTTDQTLASLASSRQSSMSQKLDNWSQLDALAAPKPAPAAGSTSMDPFELDFFSESKPVETPASYQATPPRSRARTPGDFDFNEKQDDGELSEDDILGDLAKPVRRDSPPDLIRTPNSGTPTKLPNRTVSPPPHVIGRIVEMGFTPDQARVALAATDTGMDVEAALESLLAAGGDVTSPEYYQPPESRTRPPPTRTTRAGPSQPREPSRRDTDTRSSSTSNSYNNILAGQIQPDKLLAQASEIGISMFSKANAFWNQGKEAVQKAYEENIKQTGSTPTPGDGRPKWMASVQDDGLEHEQLPAKSRFRDDTERDTSETDNGAQPASLQRHPQPTGPPVSRMKAASLFDEDGPTYVSPHRRRTPAPPPRGDLESLSSVPQSNMVPSRRGPAASPRPSPAPRRPPIVIPETSPSAIATVVSFRNKGTELFKLGQYGEAESAYTRAITALPSNHILLVALYTNRAAARLKNGDSGGAVGDCTVGLKLLGISEDLSGLMDLQDDTLTFDGVPGRLDLKGQAVKALQRRASGLEGMERWDRARADWERLAGLSWSQAQGKVKEEATRSAGRCRNMVNSATSAGTDDGPRLSNVPKPRPRPTPRAPSGPSKPSEASQRLKAADVAQEAEENEKIQLKDSVDARIQAWKAGKETNVRALIASLETVLWPELGWVKVGMHELVTPSQVKIRYTKAIAKVHPDKLKTTNTTLEQRMLANGIFGGLNEAWGAFKQ